MTSRPSRLRLPTLCALAATAAMAASLAIAPLPARAHSHVSTSTEWRKTSSCPCYLADSWDGTYFERDVGGEAFRMRLFEGSTMVAKAEFHPYGNKVWLYDTKANSDAIYWKIKVGNHPANVYAGPAGNNHRVIGVGHDMEGTKVTITAYDDRDSFGNPYNSIAHASGVA